MTEETKDPILQTISLIKDRIAEIQESGDLRTPYDKEGLLTERYVAAVTKTCFLKELSAYLTMFYKGVYPKD